MLFMLPRLKVGTVLIMKRLTLNTFLFFGSRVVGKDIKNSRRLLVPLSTEVHGTPYYCTRLLYKTYLLMRA
ncbi:hypothetical protein M501DRAFT_999897 [Patellaria atrata CBS 101060]|uniref:Uncharacterized protein n=1 Tax=Patellaria atrata CBS 101060 TaxID=1346257 RepID=A0A9P4S416_9PEZI|nr:hypothetical protein M501DRAFT_999897 [Patellaria atrata CBS 101060]